MNSIIATVFPVFAIILLGYGAARFKLIEGAGAKGLSAFVFNFAIPAMLFRTMQRVSIGDAVPWALWLAFFVAMAVIWVAAILISPRINSLKPHGGAAAGMAASYGNIVMLGIPLSVSHLGEAAIIPAALIISIHAPIQWFAGTLRAEWSHREEAKGMGPLLKDLGLSLVRNPIVMAIVLGALWSITGLGLAPVVDKTITMLGNAGIPAALFALGLSLAGFGFKGNVRGVSALLLLKLVLMPVMAWLVLTHVIALPPVSAGVVMIFAACPAGANAYLFANKYDASVGAVSGAIFLGTALSALTLPIVLWWIGPV